MFPVLGDVTNRRFAVFWAFYARLGPQTDQNGGLGGQNGSKMVENRFSKIDPESASDSQKSPFGPLMGLKTLAEPHQPTSQTLKDAKFAPKIQKYSQNVLNMS